MPLPCAKVAEGGAKWQCIGTSRETLNQKPYAQNGHSEISNRQLRTTTISNTGRYALHHTLRSRIIYDISRCNHEFSVLLANVLVRFQCTVCCYLLFSTLSSHRYRCHRGRPNSKESKHNMSSHMLASHSIVHHNICNRT